MTNGRVGTLLKRAEGDLRVGSGSKGVMHRAVITLNNMGLVFV